jgi:hypothetical protein
VADLFRNWGVQINPLSFKAARLAALNAGSFLQTMFEPSEITAATASDAIIAIALNRIVVGFLLLRDRASLARAMSSMLSL